MINKLTVKIQKTKAPIVVGLDPMLSYVPEHIQKAAFEQFGANPAGAAEAIWQFNKAIVDATYDLIPAVKPQIAMYEQFGVPGIVAYKKTVKKSVKNAEIFAYVKIFCYLCGDFVCSTYICPNGNIVVLK